MAKRYEKALFIFRRDLRLGDNTALNAALKESAQVLPIFIFDPRQVGEHPYRSDHALQFMLDSLAELEREIRSKGGALGFWEGPAESILERIVADERPQALYLNLDYTPFSKTRDERIARVCKDAGIAFHPADDALLFAPGEVLKSDGTPYTIYTPFSKAAATRRVREPERLAAGAFAPTARGARALGDINIPLRRNERLRVPGGRANGLKLVSRAAKLAAYADERDLPALRGTTGLSAHHKFGTVSVRETYRSVAAALGAGHQLVKELLWRDFFTLIGNYFPHVYGGCFHPRYDALEWGNDAGKFDAWREGRTGFPIVDAGMRELAATGFMHNRVRMITASFLTKDLHIDWRWGERHFARLLVDYDPAVNNGNWQWAASTGCDAQPYFRIFNPWLQQQRYDAECAYIKKWVPELITLSAKQIHALADGAGRPSRYPAPIVDHAEAKLRAEEMYEAAREK